MLVSSQLSHVPTVELLVEIWADRYLPNLSTLPIGTNFLIRHEVRETSSHAGRAKTAEKLPKRLLEEQCKLAAIRVKDLYHNLPEKCDLIEVVHLSEVTSCIYSKLLEVYQESTLVSVASIKESQARSDNSSLLAWGIPKIDKLANELEPLLLAFQAQHMKSKDWRALGFITTQLNFSNALILEHLTPVEQVLMTPYLNFVEEQVALPWQRICAAAANHDLMSPSFLLVKKLLPLVSNISRTVHEQLYKSFPTHYSRRGKLDNQATKHSCLRDLDMFQSYLCLCVLQGNLKAVEQELLALCLMVLEYVQVPWDMTVKATELLMHEILNHLDSQQKDLVRPLADSMVQAFHCQ